MIVVNQKLLDEFTLNHADTRKSIATWKRIVEEASWNKKQDIFRSFPHAKVLEGNRARFEIMHNKYRLIGEIDYVIKMVEVRFIGTHNQYDKINPLTI